MQDVFLNQDYQIFIWIPLVLLTIKELKANWRQIFDNDLTVSDRNSLQKINLFFIMPLVVLMHEIGHAIATIWVGGEVEELHFGIWFGYVIPSGNFTPLDSLIITLAGNVVQILIGIAFLLAALFVSSPPVVALLVYAGLYAVGGTIIIYALMSWAGWYGDWMMIYQSPLKDLVFSIGVVHFLLASALLYLIYGAGPRLWFTGKTRPKWKKDFENARLKVKEDPSAISYLSLAWSYFFVGLYNLSFKCLKKVEELDPNLTDRFYLEGCIYRNKGKLDLAIDHFERIVESQNADSLKKGRALMAVGHCLSDTLPPLDGSNQAVSSVGNLVETFDQASGYMPETADPIFYKASILNKVGLHKEAEILLKGLDGLKWLDPSLKAGVLEELRVARSAKKDDE